MVNISFCFIFHVMKSNKNNKFKMCPFFGMGERIFKLLRFFWQNVCFAFFCIFSIFCSFSLNSNFEPIFCSSHLSNLFTLLRKKSSMDFLICYMSRKIPSINYCILPMLVCQVIKCAVMLECSEYTTILLVFFELNNMDAPEGSHHMSSV